MISDHSQIEMIQEPMNARDEKWLLERVAKGNVDALNTLYNLHSGLLMSVIMGVLKDKSESEDILQESFLTIWKKASMYQPHLGKPTSWMVTIAKNKAYDRYRSLSRKAEGMNVLRENFTPQSVVSIEETNPNSDRLSEGFKELNTDQRTAIELVFYQGFTQQEAADRLKAPIGTVKARIRRGLLKLKDFLNKKQN